MDVPENKDVDNQKQDKKSRFGRISLRAALVLWMISLGTSLLLLSIALATLTEASIVIPAVAGILLLAVALTIAF